MTIAEQMNYTPTPNTGNSTDTTVYGHLYQWGRIADGHQLRNSSAVNGGSGATSITYDANSQIPFGHAWYGKYVYFGGNPRDWHGNSTTDQNDDLWNFSVPMYRDNNNPCPAGWKVPSIDELRSIFNGNSAHISGLSSGWVSVSSGNNVRMSSSNTNGMEISTDGGSTTSLFLPYAGYRSDGSNSIGGTSTYGGYWSSTPNGTDIYFVNFSNDAVFPDGSRTRAYGRSVRCLAEY